MKKKTKCYIYTRVSTSIQVDGYSLDAQRDKLRKYAEYEDMTIAGEYSDEGFSGKNIQGRLEFQRMLNDIQEGKDGVSFVLVFKLSRFGRNAADVLNSLQLMQDFGVNLICVEDGIDSSKDSGKLMISVLSAVAEIERENIRTQTMAGREQKAKEGKWNGGFAPYGYRLDNGQLLIAEDEAEVIRLIFDRYIHTNDGINGVASYLNSHEDVYFSDYEKCLDYCMHNALKEEGTDKFAIFKCKIDPELDDTSNKLGDHIEISRDGKILAIENTFASAAYNDEYTLDLDCMFDGMCFDFPTPFSRGDIVTTHGHRECSGIPFVFLYISTWKSQQMLRRGYDENECPWTKGWEEFDKCRDRLLERGDLTDMHILGVVADQGNLYHDNILVVPTDLEYYHGNLEGYNRQLRAVSLYERGKLDYEVLVNGCAAIRAEEIAKQIMEDCTRPYNKKTMQKIGLIPPDGNDERTGSHVI